jgi:hypothetical protein
MLWKSLRSLQIVTGGSKVQRFASLDGNVLDLSFYEQHKPNKTESGKKAADRLARPVT